LQATNLRKFFQALNTSQIGELLQAILDCNDFIIRHQFSSALVILESCLFKEIVQALEIRQATEFFQCIKTANLLDKLEQFLFLFRQFSGGLHIFNRLIQ
jgi:hypothetical protein